jgi:cytoskeletal protein CcmA (bactofilin family)
VNAAIKNQKGLALISALLILLSLSVVGIVAVNTSNIETLITTNTKVSKQAFFLAEAGGQEARETLRKRVMEQGSSLDEQVNLVKGPDGILETADDLPFISKTLGAGSYTVKLTDRSGKNITLTSTGFGPLNSRAVVKLTVQVDNTPAQPGQTTITTTLHPAFGIGIITDGDLRINGSSNINGGTHTNGNTRFNGSGTVTGTVSSHGSITTNGTWNTGTESPNAPTMEVPKVTAPWLAELKAKAQASGTYHSGNFNFNGSGDLGGQIIFAEGNLTLNGSIINGTIVATGNVTINGSSQINGNGIINTAIVANGNITMNGSSDSYGAFWSNGSFVQNGSSRVIGSIVSQGDITRNGSFNFTANNNIESNSLPTVTTTVTIPGTPGSNIFAVLGWKQG